ncbi:MAG: sporulation protein [Proteobacteria bacterium]|nr:sporulation protein [Pseudomonadota bacterium]NIS71349.1 sporulation protein [Pseudomonadota bacterium]
MASVPESLIKTLLEEFRSIAKTETIVGREFKAGEFTLIPISRVSLGIGAGGGSGGTKVEAKGEGGGGGGGIRIEPIAFIAVKGGEISFHGIKKGGTIEAVFEKIPEMATKIMDKIGEKRSAKKEERKGK